MSTAVNETRFQLDPVYVQNLLKKCEEEGIPSEKLKKKSYEIFHTQNERRRLEIQVKIFEDRWALECSKWRAETTLETSGEDVKTSLETSGEDVKTSLETSGEDVKTSLETSGGHAGFSPTSSTYSNTLKHR